jgi:predicted RNase H-like HicB family nuclease
LFTVRKKDNFFRVNLKGKYSGRLHSKTGRKIKEIDTAGITMLTPYIAKALEYAVFEGPEDGQWYGEIPLCPGVWATGASKEECRRELQEVLEGWLILKLRDNDPDIPVIDGIRLTAAEVQPVV